MATLRAVSLRSVLLFLNLTVFCSGDQRNITAKPGEDVTLPCRAAENKTVLVAEWIRTNLGPDKFVILYRDKQLDPDGQSEAFRNRVHLQDVKNGDVSLIIENVRTDDTGKYECRVVDTSNNQMKESHLVSNASSNVDSDPISIVNLTVVQGKKDEQKVDEEENHGGNMTLVIAGVLCVIAVAAAVAVAVAWYCKKQRPMTHQPDLPPASETEMTALRQDCEDVNNQTEPNCEITVISKH